MVLSGYCILAKEGDSCEATRGEQNRWQSTQRQEGWLPTLTLSNWGGQELCKSPCTEPKVPEQNISVGASCLVVHAPLFERFLTDSLKPTSMSQEGRIAGVSLSYQIFRKARILIKLWSYVLAPVAYCDLRDIEKV